jgi:hypothetical protein
VLPACLLLHFASFPTETSLWQPGGLVYDDMHYIQRIWAAICTFIPAGTGAMARVGPFALGRFQVETSLTNSMPALLVVATHAPQPIPRVWHNML